MADNPHAFPRSGPFSASGMTLRDWLAGQAIFAGLEWGRYHETGGYAEAAAVAYEIADAMLAERAKEPHP